jgi:hypothetical protein
VFFSLIEKRNLNDSSIKSSEEKFQKINFRDSAVSINNQNKRSKDLFDHIEKPPIAETDPKEFASILRKKLENIGKMSNIYKKDSSDTEAERMIGTYIVFKVIITLI